MLYPKFIEIEDGVVLATSAIKKISRNVPGRFLVEATDGKQYFTSKDMGDIPSLLSEDASIVPDHHGTLAYVGFGNLEDFLIGKKSGSEKRVGVPVVAWKIDRTGRSQPILASPEYSLEDAPDMHVVLSVNGRMFNYKTGEYVDSFIFFGH